MNIVQQFKYNNSYDYELIRGIWKQLLNLYILYKSVSVWQLLKVVSIQ